MISTTHFGRSACSGRSISVTQSSRIRQYGPSLCLNDLLLLTLPRAFDGYAERTVRVSSTSLVSFDRNRYSVDCKAAGRTAELRSYADKIVVMHGGECVAQHARCFPARSNALRPVALPAGAAEAARSVTQRRTVQGTGICPDPFIVPGSG